MVPAGRAHGLWLAGLLALFCLRALAQLVAAAVELPWLPRFDDWHSGLLPYPALVAAQLVIVALMVRSTRGVLRGTIRPVPRRGRVLLALSAAYACLMVLRLVLGRTSLTGHPWWDAPLSSLFHLVLAAFLGVLGHHHLRREGCARGRGRGARRLGIALACLALAPLIAEGSVRFLLLDTGAFARRHGAPLRHAGLYADPYLDDAYWRLAAVLQDEPVRGPARPHPRLGWVAPDIVLASDRDPGEALDLAGRRPLLLYGASYAACTGAPEVCFEDLARGSPLDTEFCLVNLGVGGYGVDQVLLLLRETLDPYLEAGPVVVIGVVVDSDLERASLAFRRWPKPRFRLERTSGADALVLEPPSPLDVTAFLEAEGTGIRSYAWRGLLHGTRLFPQTLRDRLAGGPALRRDQLRLIEALLIAFRNELEARAVPFFFLLFHSPTSLRAGDAAAEDGGRSSLHWRGRPSPAGSLVELLERLSIPAIDTAAYVRGSGLELAELYVTEGVHRNHPAAAGNRVLFEALLDGLERCGEDPGAE